MEFLNPLEEYSDDDDGTLSFSDLITEKGVQEIALRDSNTGSLDQEDFGFDVHFDFDFGQCCSKTEDVFPADDVFRHGRLLPLEPQRSRNESLETSSFEMSISEYLLQMRNDSVNSQSSLCSTSSSNSSSSKRKIHSGGILRLSDSKSKGKLKPPGKISAIWRVLTLGLVKKI